MKQYTDQELKNKEELFCKVQFESQGQIKKWGVQTHSLFEWLTYTTEELGELAKAIAEFEYRNGKGKDVCDEAIQVATLSLKIAEMVKASFGAKLNPNTTEQVAGGTKWKY